MVTTAQKNVHTSFSSQVRALCETDGQTDRQDL